MRKQITSMVVTLLGASLTYPAGLPVVQSTLQPNSQITVSLWRYHEYTAPTTPPAELFSPEWLAGLDTPADSYWDKVAQCETESNWHDRGNFAGGLGIALATWNGFGGEEFASKQWHATRKEQITVANRIAIHGYMNSRGQFTEPVGFNGWGCIRNHKYLQPPVGNPWQQAKEQS